MVQLVEMVVEKFAPVLYTQLGIFLPLIAVNCAILGGSLFMQQKAFVNIGEASVYGSGFRSWLVSGNCWYCRHQGKTSVFECSGAVARTWNYFYCYRFDGPCVYGFYGN